MQLGNICMLMQLSNMIGCGSSYTRVFGLSGHSHCLSQSLVWTGKFYLFACLMNQRLCMVGWSPTRHLRVHVPWANEFTAGFWVGNSETWMLQFLFNTITCRSVKLQNLVHSPTSVEDLSKLVSHCLDADHIMDWRGAITTGHCNSKIDCKCIVMEQ